MTASNSGRPLAYLGIFCVLLLYACSAGSLTETEKEQTASYQWYLLEEGLPVPLDEEALLSILEEPVPEIPWTSQMRPTGFLQANDRVFAGINRYGLLELQGNPETEMGFNAVFDQQVFGRRTLGTLFLLEGHPGVHVYVNQILGLDDPLQDKENLYFLSGDRFESFPLSSTIETGQLTDIVLKENDWFLAWRGTGSHRGRVEYEKRGNLGKPGETISPAAFRQGYAFLPLEEGPDLYKRIYDVMKKHYSPTPVVLQVTEKDTSEAMDRQGIRYYRAGKLETVQEKNALFLVLEAIRDEERYYVLFSEEKEIFCGDDSGSDLTVLRLPYLSEGVHYCSLWPLGDGFVIAWEQKDFIFTGKSGFLYIAFPDFLRRDRADNPKGM